MTLAALNFSAWAASAPSPVVATDTGSKLSSEELRVMPKTSLRRASVTPASISVDSGEITLALAGALKTLVTGSPVDVSVVMLVDLVTKGPPDALAPGRSNVPSSRVVVKGSSAS